MHRNSQLVLVGIMLGVLSSVVRAAPAEWPSPLEVKVPFEPAPFQSGARAHLVYEVYLRNFSSNTVATKRIEVFDADAKDSAPIAVFEGEQLAAIIEPIAGDSTDATQIPPGSSAVAFMWVSLEPSVKAPRHLRHRVITAGNAVEAPTIATRNDPRVLGSPVTGNHWRASDAPSNNENHHRRGVLVIDGRATISRRYAIDWVQAENGSTFAGDPRDKHSYHAYGETLRAVADARVVAVKDGLPDNVPGHNEEFHPAVPITLITAPGNSITLDLGDGQFAHYMHLQAGSLKVKPGERVRRGQLLAQIGSSGDAREPHVHFEVTTSAAQLVGEGVPYVIDEYAMTAAGARGAERRTHELPLKDDLVDFR